MHLIEALRAMSDDEISAMLTVRPDIGRHRPTNFRELATMAADKHSIAWCLDQFDQFTEQVAHALCLLPDDPTLADVVTFLAASEVGEADVAAAVGRLAAAGLVRRAGSVIHGGPTLRTAIPHPAGLGRTAAQLLSMEDGDEVVALAGQLGIDNAQRRTRKDLVGTIATFLADREIVSRLLGEAPPGTTALLDQLAVNPTHRVSPSIFDRWARARSGGRGRTTESPETWLLHHGMLLSTEEWSGLTEIPRELAMTLRGGKIFPVVSPEPPPLDTTPTRGCRAGALSAGATALRVVNAVETLLDIWGHNPSQRLQKGGLRVQDLRTAAATVGLTEADTGRLADIAFSADLLAVHEKCYVPTTVFDQWLTRRPAERWTVLVTTWRDEPRCFSLTGTRDENDKPVPPLSPQVADEDHAGRRAALLTILASVPANHIATPASLRRRLTWCRPSLWGTRHGSAAGAAPDTVLLDEVLGEAALLGLMMHGGLSDVGRILVTSTAETAPAELTHLFPEPCVEFTLQADLTAVVTGIPDPAMAAALATVATIESRGAGAVYRFSEGSIRRGMDGGQSATDILTFLRMHSPRGVPQPLAYLIEDVGRRHGRLRVGTGGTYIRSDDPALLAEVQRSRRTEKLRLRSLAPTVLVTHAPPPAVIDGLRVAGYLPVGESDDGAIIVTGHTGKRAPGGRRSHSPNHLLSPVTTRDIVAGLRATDKGSIDGAPILPFPIVGKHVGFVADDEVIDVLATALEEDEMVEIDHVDATGRTRQHIIQPIDLDDGTLYCYDMHKRDEVEFRLDRILGARSVITPLRRGRR